MKSKKYSNRNYLLGIGNGICFNLSQAFIGGKTILPIFVSNLTSSQVLIGLASSLEMASWPLPQIIVASWIEHKPKKKPLYISMAMLRIISIFVLTLIIFSITGTLLLPIFFALFTIYCVAGGIAGVPFMDIVGKTIPSTKLGSFWGWRIGVGSALAGVAGFFVKHILETRQFPTNYGILFGIATAVITVGLILFSFVEEPTEEVSKERKKFREYIREGRKSLWKDVNFRMLFYTRVLLGVSAMSFPFYIVYATKVLGFPESIVGILIVFQMFGTVLSNILWANLNNRMGAKEVLKYASILTAILPIFVFIKVGIPAAFFLMGASLTGVFVGYQSALLDIAPPMKRPTYVGFMNTMVAPSLFLPLIGGAIIQLTSYKFLFFISLIAAVVAFFTSKGITLKRG
ncbi:MAG TPA: MFS transporter [bacterium (Candidatus Stahlbacteria)]|nr:MFS transporter [Candidatus Stahlbacteria bacterium]